MSLTDVHSVTELLGPYNCHHCPGSNRLWAPASSNFKTQNQNAISTLNSCPTSLKFTTLVHCFERYPQSKFQPDRIKIDRDITHLHLHSPPSTILPFSPLILARSVSNFASEPLTIQLIHCTEIAPIAQQDLLQFIIFFSQNKLAVPRSFLIRSVHNFVGQIRALPRASLRSFV